MVDRYANAFKEEITSHGMLYLKSTEKCVPIPDNFVDIVFSLNAIDHVNSFTTMCYEILRILKKGGIFYCSFNLEESKSVTEPQVLSESEIKKNLLGKMKIDSYRITNPGPIDNIYKPFYDNKLEYDKGSQGFLWLKAEKI